MIKEVLWLISWPILMYITYLVVVYGLKKFETNKKKKAEISAN